MAVKGKNTVVKANIKNSLGKGGGLGGAKKGAANYKTSQGKGSGLKQNAVAAKIAGPSKKGTNGLNKAPMVKKTPTAKPAKQARNSVTTGDVKRLRVANALGMPKMAAGGFKNFIGGK